LVKVPKKSIKILTHAKIQQAGAYWLFTQPAVQALFWSGTLDNRVFDAAILDA